MNVSSLSSDGITTLMSSIANTTNSSTYDLYSTLTSNLGDYNSIKNGSYYKLLKNYYSSSSDDSTTSTDVTTATLSTEMKLLKVDADDTASYLKTLTSSTSLFELQETTDDSGDTSLQYSVDSIYSAVKNFISSYNDMITDGASSSTSSIFTSIASLRSTTASYYSQLSSIGISFNSDGTLSIDEDTFKASDMSAVQELFQGDDSYGSKISTTVSNLTNAINVQIASNQIYNSSGNYTTNLNALVSSLNFSV